MVNNRYEGNNTRDSSLEKFANKSLEDSKKKIPVGVWKEIERMNTLVSNAVYCKRSSSNYISKNASKHTKTIQIS